jgi:hypothetical protein
MTILALNSIRTDGGTQLRAKADEAAIDEYRDAWVGGANFPPVVVFFDGKHYWLADGFYRHAGCKKAGLDSIPADVKTGSLRDAILYAAGANATHGLRRTKADKERAVKTLLADEEWGKRSDRWVADATNTSHTYVAKIRRMTPQAVRPPGNAATPQGEPPGGNVATSGNGTCDDAERPTGEAEQLTAETPAPATRTGRDGKEYPVKAAAASPEPDQQTAEADGADGELSWGRDALKRRVPKKLQLVFDQRQEFRRAVLLLGKAGKAVEKLAGTPAGACLQVQQVHTAIRKAKEAISSAAPHTTCPYCKARQPSCDACQGRGWVDKVTFKAAPQETKA